MTHKRAHRTTHVCLPIASLSVVLSSLQKGTPFLARYTVCVRPKSGNCESSSSGLLIQSDFRAKEEMRDRTNSSSSNRGKVRCKREELATSSLT